jgi:hypothetical protein
VHTPAFEFIIFFVWCMTLRREQEGGGEKKKHEEIRKFQRHKTNYAFVFFNQ